MIPECISFKKGGANEAGQRIIRASSPVSRATSCRVCAPCDPHTANIPTLMSHGGRGEGAGARKRASEEPSRVKTCGHVCWVMGVLAQGGGYSVREGERKDSTSGQRACVRLVCVCACVLCVRRCVRRCVRASLRTCVRAVRACVRACVRFVCMHVRECVRACPEIRAC